MTYNFGHMILTLLIFLLKVFTLNVFLLFKIKFEGLVFITEKKGKRNVTCKKRHMFSCYMLCSYHCSYFSVPVISGLYAILFISWKNKTLSLMGEKEILREFERTILLIKVNFLNKEIFLLKRIVCYQNFNDRKKTN